MSKRAKISDDVIDDFEHYAARADAALTDTEVGDLISSITSHPFNAEILRRLKNDDPSLTSLRLVLESSYHFFDGDYRIEARSMGWLGYFVGESTHLKTLHLTYLEMESVNRDELPNFFDGMNRNRSVQHLTISPRYAGLPSLTQFFAENKNLVEVLVEPARELDGGIAHQLSRAMRSCTSLKSFTFNSPSRYDEGVAEIINSLNEKSNLEKVGFHGCLGRRGYRALTDLLAWEESKLRSLDVSCNGMDVQDFECLLNAVASNRKLQKLDMGYFDGRDEDEDVDNADPTLTLTRAWGSIECPLLKVFASNLVELDITREDDLGSIDNEGAIAFSQALAGNRKLKVLMANWCRLTSRGWNAVSKLLCDTSSPETTYASNHTLQDLGPYVEEVNVIFRNQIVPLLALNRNDDKSCVASAKILKTHNDFDMQVYFEWEFKMLPIAVQWLTIAATSAFTNLPVDPNIQRRKLSVIYQFVRSAPKSFVECRLRGELEEIQAREEEIGSEQERMRQELEWLQERKQAIINKLRGD